MHKLKIKQYLLQNNHVAISIFVLKYFLLVFSY